MEAEQSVTVPENKDSHFFRSQTLEKMNLVVPAASEEGVPQISLFLLHPVVHLPHHFLLAHFLSRFYTYQRLF
jgi:hypothetical protein